MTKNETTLTKSHASENSAEHSLAHVCEALTDVVSCSEDDFIALGMNLQQVQMKSSASRNNIAGVMALFQGEGDSDVLQQITEYVQRSQEQTASAQQTAADLCERLAKMVALIDTLSRKSEALERSGLFLRVIGLNTGIECSRYSQLEAIFKVVARETIDLSERVRTVTGLLLDKASTSRQEQTRTLDQARGSISDLEQLAAGTRNITRTALEKVGQLIDYSVAMVNKAEQTAVSVTTEINRVVVGIQFHDNLRQRIEHITAALLETAEPAADDIDQNRLCHIYLSMDLQKSQLDNLIDELDELYTTQSRALGNIIDEVAALETRLQEIAAGQSLSHSVDNPLTALQQGITALQGLNNDSTRLGTNIRASAARAEQIADDMQQAIQETFSLTIHIKMNALNAIIKAAKSGHYGMALQVLAQSMVDVSNDTRGLADAFEELIAELQQLARGEDDGDQSQVDMPGAAQEFDSERMQQVFTDFHTQLHKVRNECAELAQGLSRELQKLRFIPDLKTALQQATDLLTEQMEALPELDQDLLAEQRKDFGGDIHARYTMEKERSIHNRIRQGGTIVAAGTAAGGDDELSAAPAAPEAQIDLWGDDPQEDQPSTNAETDTAAADNIDLWETEAPSATNTVDLWDAPEAPVDHVDTSSDDSIAIWDEAPAAPRSDQKNQEDREDHEEQQDQEDEPQSADAAKKNRTDEDFGDNVELF
ncbi:MAG: hypothetical protein R6V33_06305 [Pelovirga sp.]